MFSEPVVGEKFFGREEVLDLLSKRASALKDGYRQNVALTGQSLSGKSSIILHFLHAIQEEGFIPVYVEVVKEPFRQFANKFISTMLYNALMRKGEAVGIEMEKLIARAQELIPKTAQAAKQVLASIDRGESEEAYSALLGLTSTVREELGIPCIVILDEFDNLEHLGVKNPFMSFGKVIMVQKDTMYIVSSSRDTAIRKIISEKLSLLFGNFEVVKVSNFGLRVADEFIATRLSGFEVDGFAKRFMIALTDGNPFYLNTIVMRAKDIALGRMTNFIDKDILAEAIIDLVYNSSGTIHQYLMNYMLELLDSRSKDLHCAMLVAIAGGGRRQPDIAKAARGKQQEVARALVKLTELGIISKNGVFYSIDDVMFEFWLKNVYQRKKEILVDGTFDKRRLFKDEIIAYMDLFEKEYAMSVAERIATLLGLFSNELVCLEQKNARLPHFTKVDVRAFPDGTRYVAASFRGNTWITQPFERDVNENDIVNYIRNVKALDCKLSNKVIIPLKGIDENAKLLAKELKISIWDSRTVNTLLSVYGKKRIVIL